jgi:hypothetical protein
MAHQDQLILFRVAQWVDGGNRKVVKTIRQLAETNEPVRVRVQTYLTNRKDQGENART